jgi:hypothetical protein
MFGSIRPARIDKFYLLDRKKKYLEKMKGGAIGRGGGGGAKQDDSKKPECFFQYAVVVCGKTVTRFYDRFFQPRQRDTFL